MSTTDAAIRRLHPRVIRERIAHIEREADFRPLGPSERHTLTVLRKELARYEDKVAFNRTTASA